MSESLDLGRTELKVTTSSQDCLQWLSRGTIHMFGFNPEEAIRCFQKGLSFDPTCAMAHYFISNSYAPNYNDQSGLDSNAARKEAQLAIEMFPKQSPSPTDWEVALMQVKSFQCAEGRTADCRDYCNAMRTVYKKFGSDNSLVAALFAESLMMLAPWALWTRPPVIKPAIPETEELVKVLETGLERDATHPGLCHFYIHTMELSATPEKALPVANALRSLVPDQGHLLHMASHIDMWIGQYKEAVEINNIAVTADEKYVQVTGQDNEMFKMYRFHNYHFAVWAAMFDGQYFTAMKYAEGACRQLPPSAIKFTIGDTPVGQMYFESFGSLPWHVLVRFGKWEEILARPLPQDPDLCPSANATAYYARGLACAVLGRLSDADRECQSFQSALQNKKLTSTYIFNNVMHDPEKRGGILDVAEAVLQGEVEYFKGNKKEAFEHLRLAVQRDLSMVYDEPWGWMMPARHALGALLLEDGQLEEAEKVYRNDSQQYKNNLWSLLGLQQVLTRLGCHEEADTTQTAFLKASTRAEVDIRASCFCAKTLCCK